MNSKEAKITLAFCDAVFKACPWIAPPVWTLRQTFGAFSTSDFDGDFGNFFKGESDV